MYRVAGSSKPSCDIAECITISHAVYNSAIVCVSKCYAVEQYSQQRDPFHFT